MWRIKVISGASGRRLLREEGEPELEPVGGLICTLRGPKAHPGVPELEAK